MAHTIADRRGVDIECILEHDWKIPRCEILEALGDYYQTGWIEFDERIPVPPELLEGLNGRRMCESQWFPVLRKGNTIVVAACDPDDPMVEAEARAHFPGSTLEFRVVLHLDMQAFLQDFLHASPGELVGTERTGLAFWRNTMARWRTRLACYRTDLGRARTCLTLLRAGLMLIALARALMQVGEKAHLAPVYWLMVAVGIGLIGVGSYSYRTVRKSSIVPPKHETLVEVTAAVVSFLDGYRFVEKNDVHRNDLPSVERNPSGKTMLVRLVEYLMGFNIDVSESHDNKDRSYLAHERNLFAAQRTAAACYRTVYARARTGLSFIRTGIAIAGLGVGFVEYFGTSWLTILDGLLIAACTLLIVDGCRWYLPARKEKAEVAHHQDLYWRLNHENHN